MAIDHSAACVQEEVFVPILYVTKFSDIDDAIAMNNSVPQGLSSSIFTNDSGTMWKWLGGGQLLCWRNVLRLGHHLP